MPQALAAASAPWTLGDRPARGNAERNVPPPSERVDLAREHVKVAVVVGNGRDDARVGRQRDGAERPPLDFKPSHELSSEMLSIRCTAAVAERQDLAAAREGLADRSSRLDDAGQPVAGKSLMSQRRLVEDCAHSVRSAQVTSFLYAHQIYASMRTSPRQPPHRWRDSRRRSSLDCVTAGPTRRSSTDSTVEQPAVPYPGSPETKHRSTQFRLRDRPCDAIQAHVISIRPGASAERRPASTCRSGPRRGEDVATSSASSRIARSSPVPTFR